MIREIINFTKDIIEDCPDIMQRNLKPNGGLYIFVDIDEDGNWVNENGVYGWDYLYLKIDDSESPIPISDITALEEEVKRVGTMMNKVLDKKKQIFSCSPFAVVFKKKSLSNEKIEGIKGEKISKLLSGYFENAKKLCPLETYQIVVDFERICGIVLNGLESFIRVKSDGEKIELINQVKDDEYISIFLKSVSLETYTNAHDRYFKDKLFNTDKFNKTEKGILYGLSSFLNGLNSKKIFLLHRTASMDEGLCGRISSEDALLLDKFQSLILRKVLPNPLPIAVNQRKINQLFLELFHENETPLSYRELIKSLFEQHEIKELSEFYLLNYSKAKDIVINDIDFVPMFRYYFDKPLLIENVMLAGYKQDGIFEEEKDISLKDIFTFEYTVVREIFNNCLVTIKKDGSYKSLYFGDVDLSKRSDNGKFLIYQLIMKYRYAFYEYIYKSKQNAINAFMFDELMFTSILASIKNDEVKSRFSFNNVIKRKLNIWFSLYNLFNNDKKKEVMASNVTDLMSKMRIVAKGEAVLETPEEFAFAAGQLVSYLMDQSVASNKTYSMLEPYLQKTKSKHLQDAIAHVFSQYKHAVSIYGKAFNALASNVLTYNEDIDMKPLLKYFLAGCFSNCVIYEKKEEN